jgi:CheY-like chemotaxis protein
LLIIDDNLDELRMLRAALGSEYDIVDASDGLEGYALASARPPSAIVLDIAMPLVDGWTVLRKLRTNAVTKDVPIVIFTALEPDDVLVQARGFGVDSIVRKPVPPTDLDHAIRRAIRS